MGKNKGGGNDRRAREKFDHRGGGKGDKRGAGVENDDVSVPQELIDRAAVLGCEVWEVDEYEAK